MPATKKKATTHKDAKVSGKKTPVKKARVVLDPTDTSLQQHASLDMGFFLNQPILNWNHCNQWTRETTRDFREAFLSRRPYATPIATVKDGTTTTPLQAQVIMDENGKAFPVGWMPSFLNEDFANEVKEALLKLDMDDKDNDLYRFQQSKDFQNMPRRSALGAFREWLMSPDGFVRLLSDCTGISLHHGRVDMAGQSYVQGDHLLCHDDDIQDNDEELGRRIAFILYLVDQDWSETDGGQLELFCSDDNHLPVAEIASRVVPQWNSMAFFEVTPTSYHQVAEIVSKKERLSITGWFYGPLKDCRLHWPSGLRKPQLELLKVVTLTADADHDQGPSHGSSLSEWINPAYLKHDSMEQVNVLFVNESHAELFDFLIEGKYVELEKALDLVGGRPDKKFVRAQGPPNVCRYLRVDFEEKIYVTDQTVDQETADALKLLEQFRRLLASPPFLEWISTITNLRLLTLGQECRLFGPGDYTLIHDLVREEYGVLDVNFDLTSALEWDEEDFGGCVTYLDADEHLLSIVPHRNSLNLVFRDAGGKVMRFVKYVTREAPAVRCDFSLTFKVE